MILLLFVGFFKKIFKVYIDRKTFRTYNIIVINRKNRQMLKWRNVWWYAIR